MFLNITKYLVSGARTLLLTGLFGGALPLLCVHAETVEVSIYKKEFIPSEVTIHQGDTVRWVNNEKRQYHNVWFKELGELEGDYFFPEESVERTFNDVGKFPYECGPHPKMKGVVTVVPKTAQGNVKPAQDKTEEEISYLVKQDCGSCHGMLLKGGLGPALLPENIKAFSVEDLVAVILHGRPGTPMPPWNAILSETDARLIASRLKAGEFVDNAN